MIVCGFNKNLQLNERSTGKNSSNFPIVFPPLKSQLDIIFSLLEKFNMDYLRWESICSRG